MSTDFEGWSSELSLTVEPNGTPGIDARVLASLDTFDILDEVVDVPQQLWAALVIYPKPRAGTLPATFSDRARRDDLMLALTESGEADVFFVESTLAPPRRGRNVKANPSIVIFAFLSSAKFAHVHETLKTVLLIPDGTYSAEVENLRLVGVESPPARRPFNVWRTSRRPIIAAGLLELYARVGHERLRLFSTIRYLAVLVSAIVLLMLLQCAR